MSNTREDWARRHLAELHHQGFDKSKIFNGSQVHCACTWCYVLWTHEAKPKHYPDCPNKRYFCRECDCFVVAGVEYCEECKPFHLEAKPAAESRPRPISVADSSST